MRGNMIRPADGMLMAHNECKRVDFGLATENGPAHMGGVGVNMTTKRFSTPRA